MSINQIAEGFYNKVLSKEQELFNERMKICKECKLLKIDNLFGEVCNRNLYLNPNTDEVSRTPKVGFNSGCGCVLSAKCRVKDAKCPNKK